MQILGSILRFLFAWIDGIVAKVITLVYGLLSDLANLTLYSENIVKVIGQRIGILLGIFMLFRIAVSLINYMISPDKVSDSKQGGGALVKNVIISLALLATVNVIFETAYSVQEKIIKSQIIEKIFFGETSQTKMDIGYYLYTGFFTPNTEVLSSCANMWDITKDLQRIPCDEYDDGKCPTDVKTCDSQLSELLEDTEYKSVYDARNNLDMSKVFSDYGVVMANKGGAFKGQLLFNYIPIISTAAGVVTLLIMISFSMELAKRAIKLLFLQIVAPVPIIFNMDTGKGKEVFQKWYKQCFNTYISIFIRILAIDFAVFIIVLLKGQFSNLFQDKIGVNIFIIIGCLLFAKEVPKLIEDMLGIKLDGMSLRPIKKFQDQALFGKQIAGVGIGAAAGTVAGLRAAGANMFSPGKGGRILGAGAGFTSALSKSVVGGFKGEKFGKNISNSYNAAMDNKDKRAERIDDGVGFWEWQANKFQHATHQKTRGQRADALNKSIDTFKQNGESIKNAIFANDKAKDSMSVNGRKFDGAKGLKEFIDSLQGPVQERNETAADFAKRQQEFIAEKKKYQDALDLRVAEVSSGRRAINDGNGGRSGGAAANAAVRETIETMRKQRDSINEEGTALYGREFNLVADPRGFTGTAGDYDTTAGRTMGMKSSLGSAAGAQTTISSHAVHDRDVDKYGTKKDAK